MTVADQRFRGFSKGKFFRRSAGWGFIGLLLLGLHLLLTFVSSKFVYGLDHLEKPIPLLVGLEMFAGSLYLLVVKGIRDTRSRGIVLWIIVVGAALRLSLLASNPMLEDDYYRYLWDGAVTGQGMNPYAFSPEEIEEAREDSDLPSSLRQLASESGIVFSRINHPHLRTIYPPVAQAVFGVSYRLGPWSITAWRLTLLVFDAATLVILMIIFRTLGIGYQWLAVYWWNPLLLKEIANSGHMDVILMPLVLGAVLMAMRRRYSLAAGTLALATGVKLWPIILLPIILRPILFRPRRLIPALSIFGLLSFAMFFPVYISGLDAESGFLAYGRRWEMNDAIFMLFLWGSQLAMKGLALGTENSQLAARIIVLLVLAGFVARLIRNDHEGHADLFEKCLLAIAALFLLSPTQFPWYYVWMIPFLAVRPRMSLLLLTAVLPLYYLRFYLSAMGKVGIFDYGIVWLEYVPVLSLLAWEWHKKRYALATAMPEVSV